MLRYEDLIEDPKTAIEGLAPLAEEINWNLDFIQENRIETKSNHTVAGNPMRFETGTIELSPDLEWRTKTPWLRRLYVNAIAWPQIWTYDYYSSRD